MRVVNRISILGDSRREVHTASQNTVRKPDTPLFDVDLRAAVVYH
jgi:hypothetical protein